MSLFLRVSPSIWLNSKMSNICKLKKKSKVIHLISFGIVHWNPFILKFLSTQYKINSKWNSIKFNIINAKIDRNSICMSENKIFWDFGCKLTINYLIKGVGQSDLKFSSEDVSLYLFFSVLETFLKCMLNFILSEKILLTARTILKHKILN